MVIIPREHQTMTGHLSDNKGLSPEATFAALVSAAPQLHLGLDHDGVVRELQYGEGGGMTAAQEAVIGTPLPDLLPPEAGARLREALRRALECNAPATMEYTLAGNHTCETRLIPFSCQIVAMVTNVTAQKRIAEMTRLIETRFHEIFRTTSAGMVLGAPDGSFIEVNPAFCRFLGYTMDELLKLTVEEITHPDDRERSRIQRSPSLQGNASSYTYEKRYLRKDGSTVWGQLSSNWFHDADGRPLYAVGIIQDITERKRMEEALRESEAKFAKAFHATPTWLVISTVHDGRFIEMNEAFERICGYGRQEVIDRTALDLDIWENGEDRKRVTDTLLREGKVRDLEANFKGKTGKIFAGLISAELVEINGEQCMLTLVNDITARKRAEEALRESEERFRRLYSETPAMLHSIDQGGRLLSVSNHWLEVLGYERSEVIGRKSTEFLTEASRRYAEEVVLPAYFRTGLCKDVPYQFVTKGGATIDVLLSATAERDGCGEVIRSMAVMTDVTERKRAEDALRESEEKFSKAFRATPTILVIATLAEGRYIEVNEAFERAFGYRREEAIGRTSRELDIWEDPADRDRYCRPIREGGPVRDMEIGLRGKGGKALVGLVSGEVIELNGEQCLLSLVNDITARRTAEEALRESEEKFSKAFRANPSPLTITTLTEGRFIEVNEAFERVFGYGAEEAIGHSSLELNIWQYTQDRERIIRVLRDKERVCNEEVTFRDRNGKAVIARYSAELIDLRGEPCVLSLVDDITARKQLEEEVEVLHTDLACRAAELVSANRELETFSHTVSHDLRSPLTGIVGYSEFLLEYYGERLDEQCRGFLEHIHNAGLRMGHLINALLDFSRLTRGEVKREAVDLSGLAQEIAIELRLEAPERPATFRIAEGITVSGDSRLLRAVLQNLLGNAWKYTARNDAAAIEFGVVQEAGAPVYFVRDNGVGFDMSQAERLFVPFQRLHDENEFTGSGIGLATVERIIRRHGGRIWAEGEPGKGACFYFTIP
jgi:PAS domain S-box-containing protein